MRTLFEVRVRRQGHLVTIDVIGDAFLRQMVRSIVAALIRIGMGRATAEDLVSELRSPGRAFAGAVVPPHGLCLRRVTIGPPRRNMTNEGRTTRAMSRTYTPKASEIERRWLVVDADGQTLGRLATRVARLLTGKHKPAYATHIDAGDHVIVVNAAKIKVTGDKAQSMRYSRHSGYPGGYREETLRPAAGAPTRGGRAPRGQGHGAAHDPGHAADAQAEGLRRQGPSA